MAASIASFTLSNSPATYAVTQTASVSWNAGDRIVVGYAAANGAQAPGTPTATGLAFAAAPASPGTGTDSADCGMFEAFAPAAGSSVTISMSTSGNTDPWCFGVWVVTGNPGDVGASSATATTQTSTDTSRSLATGAGDIVLMVESDWLAVADPQGLSAGSGTSNKRDNADVSGYYTYLFGEWVGTAATTASYGADTYSNRRCATAAVVVKASPSAITATSKVAKATGSSTGQTYAAGSTSYTAGRRLVVFGHALRDNHTAGFGIGADGWGITDTGSTNDLTWTLLGVSDIDTSIGATYGTQSAAFISSPLSATESFDITLDANANGTAAFYWAMNVVEVNGATDTLAQALQGNAAAGGTGSITFAQAPDGFQLASMFALCSHDDIVFGATPADWAELASSTATVNGGQSCKVMWSTANVATGVSWSWSSSGGTELVSTLIAIELADAAATTLDQDGFRWGADDGNEAAHGWAADEDTNLTAVVGAKLLRVQVDGTGDPAAKAFSLRYQKNGAGGYSAVPVGSLGPGTATPTIEAADTTSSGDNATTPTTPWAMSVPAAATGDLIIAIIAWDDSVNNTGVTLANGPNGETWTQVHGAGVPASSGTEVRMNAFRTIATGTWSAGTIAVTPNANEQWTATVIKVPAGEFDATTPIGATAIRNSAGTAESSVLKPDITAGATDGSGRLVWAGAVDVDPLVTLANGYTSIANNDRGQVALGVAIRDAAVTANEAVTDGTWSIASDSWCSYAFIVRPPGAANELYVAASGNIAAGGEATTARLTAPSGKTTSNFTAGRRWDDENGTDTIDIASGNYTEVEWSLTTQSPAADTDYFDFRVYADGAVLDTYSVTPRWTIGSGPTQVTGVAAVELGGLGVAANGTPSAVQVTGAAAVELGGLSTAANGMVPGNPLWETVTHDFPGTSLDTTLWNGNYGTLPTVHDNVLDYSAVSATYCGVHAIGGRSLIGSYVTIQIDTLPVGGYSGLAIKSDASDALVIELQVWTGGTDGVRVQYKGSLWGGADDATTVTAITPTAGMYLRLRESGGTLYAETSTDYSNWTLVDSYSPSASALTALADSRLQLDTGPYPDAQSAGAKFAKLNLQATVQVTGAAAVELGALTVAANGTPAAVQVTGTAAVALGALTVAANGTTSTVQVTGAAAVPLGALTVAANGAPTAVQVTGSAAVQLGALTVTAAGVDTSGKWHTVTHEFPGTTLDATFWPGWYGTNPTIHDGLADWTGVSAAYAGIQTGGKDLISSYVTIKVPTLPVGGYAGLEVQSDASGALIVEVQVLTGATDGVRSQYKGSLWSGADDAITDTNLVPAAGCYLRLAESGGTLTTSYSTDGLNWSTVDTYSPSAGALTALADCRVQLSTGPFPDAQTAGPTFSSLNVLPAPPVEGVVAVTLGGLTVAAAGTPTAVQVTGAAAVALGALTTAANGTPSAVQVTGVAAVPLGALTTAASGVPSAVQVSGAAVVSLGALTTAASGAPAAVQVTGAAAVPLGALTTIAAGSVQTLGAAAVALGALTIAAAGTPSAVQVTGSAAVDLGALGVAASGSPSAVQVTGAATVSLGSLGVAAAGTPATVQVSGAAAVPLGALSVAAQGTPSAVQVTGAAAVSLGGLGVAASGAPATVQVTGAAAVALGALSVAAAGTPSAVQVSGSAAVALGALAVAASGTPAAVEVTGAGDVALGGLSVNATGTPSAVQVTGTAAIDLGALAVTASGAPATVQVTGAAAVQLGALVIDAFGDGASIPIFGAAVVQLGGISVAAAGSPASVEVTGASSVQLGGLTTSAAGAPQTYGAATVALGGLAVAATGAPAAVEVTGAAAVDLGALTVTASGAPSAAQVTGSASVELPALAITTAGTPTAVEVQGAASIALGGLTVAANGVADATGETGQALVALGGLSVAVAGTPAAVEVQGAATVALGGLVVAAAGTPAAVEVLGAASVPMSALTVSAAGTSDAAQVDGSASVVLGALDVAAQGTPSAAGVDGVATVELGGLSVASAGTVQSYGAATVSLGGLGTSAVGNVGGQTVLGAASVSLGGLSTTTLGSSTAVRVPGAASINLGGLTIGAAGSQGTVIVRRLRVWDGSQWHLATAKVWTGTEWRTTRPRAWNGSTWV